MNYYANIFYVTEVSVLQANKNKFSVGKLLILSKNSEVHLLAKTKRKLKNTMAARCAQFQNKIFRQMDMFNHSMPRIMSFITLWYLSSIAFPFQKFFDNLPYTLIMATSLLVSTHTMGSTFSLLGFAITIWSRDQRAGEVLCRAKALTLRGDNQFSRLLIR